LKYGFNEIRMFNIVAMNLASEFFLREIYRLRCLIAQQTTLTQTYTTAKARNSHVIDYSSPCYTSQLSLPTEQKAPEKNLRYNDL